MLRSGKVRVLVATDVAARGLDVRGVQHVINFDCPHGIDDYVHRIGRTGRAGHMGFATAFFSSKDRGLATPLLKTLQSAKQDIPAWLQQLGVTSHSSRGRQGPIGRGRGGRGGYQGGGGGARGRQQRRRR
eukprot:COSAG01_NODE_4381_length_5082_cov_57.158539_2_plen_130_part_00